MNPIQILLVIFFLFAMTRVVARYRQHSLSKKALFFWIIFWISAAVIVILPDSTFYLAHLVGVTRGADLVVYVGMALLFFSLFRLMVRLEKQDREITELTRKMALYDKDKEL